MTEKPLSFEAWVSAQGLDPKRLDRMQESLNRRLYDYEMNLKALEVSRDDYKRCFYEREDKVEELLKEINSTETERATLKEQLESFTMRFGSYGTYNHTDILKEIERLNELTHTLDKAVKLSEERAESAEDEVQRLYKRIGESDAERIEAKDRLAKAQEVYRTIICEKKCTNLNIPCLCPVAKERLDEALGGQPPKGDAPDFCTKGEVKE